ncbi:hypothetical protein CFC21_094893 [Triticum aestivum]|uniref:F-box associated domain-containing protein n=2 Tax=Triticum aestivum TaxID=4565 RepID=A0A9R1LP37_WHEAT|nr:hypothetical protein CFC21_094880 [Triticum aestivum]KAF7092403.1 hypothetical protein CFC21_094893 [Triticum aestivum]
MKARRFLNVLTDKYSGPDALYVMDRKGHSFEAFVYGDPDPPPPSRFMDEWYRDRAHRDRCVWHWRDLPPPPIVVDEGDNYYHDLTPLSGTYCFNTRTGEWTKAGDWKLPFWSRALHVPELGSDLLFGFENTYFHIHSCFSAVDVSGARRMDGSAPALRHAWVKIDPPSGWHEQDRSMVYLGDGKFCIHRSFDIMETYGWSSGHEERVDTVVLLTGVEVVREGSRLRMVKHKSKRLDTYIASIL